MTLTVLLSAMFLKDENYIDSLNVESDAVVINQCDANLKRKSGHITPKGKNVNVTYIETTERGLSKSRNMAIENAEGDILCLCDNDVEYEEGYADTILDVYRRHADADVVVSFIKRPERSNPITDKEKRMGYLSVLKIFSPEISFKKEAVKDIRFNESFGAGAEYIMGEENIFLYECLKRHKKIYYNPKMIAATRDEESTWFKGYDEKFFISRGANYAAMSGIFSYVLIIQFALRKTRLYRDNFTRRDAVKIMLRGRKEYLGKVLGA